MYQNNNKKNGQMGIIFLILAIVFVLVFVANPKDENVDKQVLGGESQAQALQRLANESGRPIEYIENYGEIRHLSMSWKWDGSINAKESVDQFLMEYRDLFMIQDPSKQLLFVDQFQDEQGFTVVKYEQVYYGVPVFGSGLSFHIDKEGHLDWYEGNYIPNLSLDVQPRINQVEIQESIQEQFEDEGIVFISEPVLGIIDTSAGNKNQGFIPRLIWQILVITEEQYNSYYLDANSGQIVNKFPVLLEAVSYFIYDAHQQWWKPYGDGKRDLTLVMNHDGYVNTNIFNKQESERLRRYIHQTYDFYNDNFEWMSYDGEDSPLYVYIHYKIESIKFGNAYWDPTQKFIAFNSGMVQDSIDIFAHEFTHGVTQELLGVDFNKMLLPETSALLESFSDVFASFIDEDHPWKMCIDSCEARFWGGIIRDLEDPGNLEHPKHTENFAEPGDEICKYDKPRSCGHINSTIHSYAVYMFTQNIGESKASQILFRALRSNMMDGIQADENSFTTARRAVVGACYDFVNGNVNKFNIQTSDCEAIEDAYNQVGIVEDINVVNPVVSTLVEPTQSPIIDSVPGGPASQTVLLIDVSGSMDEQDASGTQKLLGAQRAASNLANVILAEQNAVQDVSQHTLGLIGFQSYIEESLPLSTEIMDIQDVIWDMNAGDGTAMAYGLQEALSLFDESADTQQMIVLLSDGMPSVGLNFLDNFLGTADKEKLKQEVLDIAGEANPKGICVHTIGFGNPNANPDDDSYIDESFLRQVASASGCGQYFAAQEATQLANSFVELRHSSMGTLAFKQNGRIQQGETVKVGNFDMPGRPEQMLFTLNWPGSRLVPQLIDPRGVQVDENYSGAVLDEQDTITTIIVDKPIQGDWQVNVFGENVPEGTTDYNILVSTRGEVVEESSQSSAIIWVVLVIAGVTGFFLLNHNSTAPISSSAGTKNTDSQNQIHQAVLEILNGNHEGKSVIITEQALIGRGSSCSVIFSDPSVSRRHAVVFYHGSGWHIQDQGSKAGIVLNGHKGLNFPLHHGDIVQLGKVEIKFNYQ